MTTLEIMVYHNCDRLIDEKRDHLGFFTKIEFLAYVDSFVYAA